MNLLNQQFKVRVLCLDIEGGFGGSSRSLYFALKHLDRNRFSPEVWCKRDGPIKSKYEALGIPVRIHPWLPKVTSLPRFSRNCNELARFAINFICSRSARHMLVDEVQSRFDIIHYNHEGLYLLAAWMCRQCDIAQVMHNRTQLPPNVFSRLQARLIVESNDQCIFISERERDNITMLANQMTKGVVISNVVEPEIDLPVGNAGKIDGSKFTVASLANYSWMRGTDRLVEIATNLKAMGRMDIQFVVAGKLSLTRSLPGQLGQLARKGKTLDTFFNQRGVGDMFRFLGHVENPEQVLASANVLIRPSREDNPWGRDVLEAMAMGVPVLACGTYEKFVRPGVSGYLYPNGEDFDPSLVARDIAALADDRAKLKKLGEGAREIVISECNGNERAADLATAWLSALVEAKKRRKEVA